MKIQIIITVDTETGSVELSHGEATEGVMEPNEVVALLQASWLALLDERNLARDGAVH